MRSHPEATGGTRLVFDCGGRTVIVPADEVSRVSGEGNYSRVHLAGDRSVLVRLGIAALAERLQAFGFRRVHRSHLVRLEHIREIHRVTRYKFTVVLAGGDAVPLTQRYLSTLVEAVATIA